MAASSSSATVAVEKATSDLLMGPDWTMNIEICDSINSNHWQPKDVVKAVKKRLQHKSSKVQLLALTLLETMVKNCGEYVHFQIAERNILGEMIKIVRKKADMHVRDKILLLLDSWQEAFGGPGGKCPQYYWAYEELKRSGVVFPKRSPDAAPIFTPPPTHLTARHMQPGYGMPSNSSKTLDETMATEIESLSFSSLDSMHQVLDLLSDMLQAVNPNDREAVKDEVIIDLVDRCRTNQKKLMQMLTTTGDEELLGRGLELNDTIQSVLARHDAIVSGTPFPFQGASSSTLSSEVDYSDNQTEVKSSSPLESVSTPNSKASSSALVIADTRGLSDEEDEDEFAQLAQRHSKTQSVTSKDATSGSSDNLAPTNTSNATPHVAEPSTSVPSNALALPNPPAPVSTSKDQDIIDLLSLTLSLAPSSPQQTTYTPSASSQGMHQIPPPSGTGTEGYSYSPQTYPGSLPFDSYVVPWAQPQPQSQSQPTTPPSHQHLHTPFESKQALHHQQTQQPQSQHQSQLLQSQHQPQSPQALQPQPQSQFQNQHIQYNPPQQMQHHNEPQPLQYQPQPHLQPQPQHHPHFQPHPQPQLQSQPQPQPIQQSQPQPQPQHIQQSPQQMQLHNEPQPLQYQPQPHLQPQPQHHPHFQPHPQPQLQSQPQPQPIQQSQPQPQPQHIQQSQPQPQPQPRHIQQSQPQPATPQHFQYPGTYPPPPWAATPGYPNYQNHLSSTNALSTPQANTHYNTSAVRGDPAASSGPSNPANATGQRPFVPSYRLFEDLNVFGNTDGRAKVTGSGTSSSSMSGTMGPGMVGGRK